MKLERRLFILGTSYLGINLLTGCRTVQGSEKSRVAANASPPLVIRKRWSEDSKSDFQTKYVQAVAWLKENDKRTFAASDPRTFLSWNKMIAIHETCCPHGSQHLLPWHRLYLLYFEAACQLGLNDPTFALPYWDWTKSPFIPKEFYEIEALQADRKLAQGASLNPELVNETVIENLLAIKDFPKFHGTRPIIGGIRVNPRLSPGAAGSFEFGPHNAVHNGIGGIMANPLMSPTDPIFWLHHSNIDRIWANWQALNPDTKNYPDEGPEIKPIKGTFQDELGVVWGEDKSWRKATMLLRNSDEPSSAIDVSLTPEIIGSDGKRGAPSRLTCENLVDARALGYVFDDVSPEAPRVSNKHVVKPNQITVRSVKPTSVTQKDGILAMIFASDETLKGVLALFAQDSRNEAELSIKNIPFPEDESFRQALVLRFFLAVGDDAVPDLTKKDAYKLPEYVGYYTFFVAGHHHSSASRDEAAPFVAASFSAAKSLYAQVKAKGAFSSVKLFVVPYNQWTEKADPQFLSATAVDTTMVLSILKNN